MSLIAPHEPDDGFDEEFCPGCLEPADECACGEEDICPYCQCLNEDCTCDDIGEENDY